MPRKVKKQSKKRIYKKRKGTTVNKNKNKNIIKINVSTGGSGSGGSSVIPVPYPTSIGATMFPTQQPVNIYNTMSRNPFETEYNPPEKAFLQEPEPVKIPYEPEPVKIPYEPEPEKFQSITAPKKIDFIKPPQFGLGMMEEIKRKQEEMGLIKKKDKAEIPSKKVGLGIMMEEIKRKQEEMGLRNMEEGAPIPIYLTNLKNMEKGIQIPFVPKISPIQEKQSSIPKKRIRLPLVIVPEPSTHSILSDNEPQGIRFIMPEPSTHSIFKDNEVQGIRFNQSRSKQATNEEKPYATYIEKQASIPKKERKKTTVIIPEPSTYPVFTDNEPQGIRFNQSRSKQAINEEKPYATYIEKQSSIPKKERKKPIAFEQKFTPVSNTNLQFENPLKPDNSLSLKSQLDKAKSQLNKANVLEELKKQQQQNESEFKTLNINELQQNQVRRNVLLDYKNFNFNPIIIEKFKSSLNNEVNPDGTPLTNHQKGARIRYFKESLIKSYNAKVSQF
jgi:hypothetical protein